MVGSAIVRRLAGEGCEILTVGRSRGRSAPPAAGRGLDAGRAPRCRHRRRGDRGRHPRQFEPAGGFLYDNLAIEANLIQAAHRAGRGEAAVPRLVLHLSQIGAAADERGCAADRPARADQRVVCHRQDRRHQALPGLSQAIWRDFISAMPTNLYGPGDNFDLASSHVVPALMRKIDEAKRERRRAGRDLGHRHAQARIPLCRRHGRRLRLPAEALQRQRPCQCRHRRDLTIRELAETIARVVGYRGGFVYDRSKPDGTPRKLMDVLAAGGARLAGEHEPGERPQAELRLVRRPPPRGCLGLRGNPTSPHPG